MSSVRLLFLYPTQAVATRKPVYVEACRALAASYDHSVVFCYNGPRIDGLEDLNVEHFETWVEAHRDEIDRESLIALEARFLLSNLWRCVVIERNLTDYSYVGSSSIMSAYSVEELEWYLKALVLFYDHVLDDYKVNVAFNQVSDNVHAHVVYELARSKNILSLGVGRGLYWFDDMVYPHTEQNFGSEVLREQYRLYRNGGAPSAERKEWIDQQLEKFCSTEARAERPAILYDKSLKSTTKNAFIALRQNFTLLKYRRLSVLESNLYLNWYAAIKAYIVRCANLAAMRAIVRQRDLPPEPFMFFPLHVLPEAAVLGASPGYLDLLALVRLLSASLPAGYRLVVKDHPVTGGMHAPGFYRSIKELKNVVLLDDRVSGRAITRTSNCVLIATVGGTVGLEAMLFGKPVLMLGRAHYDCMDTLLHPPADLNDLPLFLKRTLVCRDHARSAEIEADCRTFFAAWLSTMMPARGATYWAQADTTGAGRDWARVVHELILQVAPEITGVPADRSYICR